MNASGQRRGPAVLVTASLACGCATASSIVPPHRRRQILHQRRLCAALPRRKSDGSRSSENDRPEAPTILHAVKGADLRRNIGRGTPAQRRHAIRYLDEIIDLLKTHDARMIARIWIKGIAAPFDGRPVYTSSIQAICEYFQPFLTEQNDYGLVISDSRTKALNVNVSHSVFTQKYRFLATDTIGYMSFQHSHTAIIMRDYRSRIPCALQCSFRSHRMFYCAGHVTNVQVQPDFVLIKARYAPHLRSQQYRYQDAAGSWRRGIVVADAIAQRSGSAMFK
jgi:hypothetical protein